MSVIVFLATEYGPNHNFWSGSPADWWMRGIMGALLVNAPVLVLGPLLILLVRKWRN